MVISPCCPPTGLLGRSPSKAIFSVDPLLPVRTTLPLGVFTDVFCRLSNDKLQPLRFSGRRPKRGDADACRDIAYKAATIEQVTGDVLLHWLAQMETGGQPASSRWLVADISRQDLVSRLETFLALRAKGFERIEADELGLFLPTITVNHLKKGLDWAKQHDYIRWHETSQQIPDIGGRRYMTYLALTPAGRQRIRQPLEEAVLNNAGFGLQLAANLRHRIRTGQLAPGDVVAPQLTLAGEPTQNGEAVPKNVRNNALAMLAGAGFLQRTYVSTAGEEAEERTEGGTERRTAASVLKKPVFRVLTPSGQRHRFVSSSPTTDIQPVPARSQVNWNKNTRIGLLYYLMTHPQQLVAGADVPADDVIQAALHAGQTDFKPAKRALTLPQPHGFLTARKQRPYAIDHVPDNTTWAVLARTHINQRDQAVIMTITNLNNRDKNRLWPNAQALLPTVWPPNSQATVASQTRMVSDVANALTYEAPVPLMGQRTAGRSKTYWLNPWVNYNQLATNMARVLTSPLTMLSGLRLRQAPWQLPQIYQDQVFARPTAWVYEDDGQAYLSWGLTYGANGNYYPIWRLHHSALFDLETPPHYLAHGDKQAASGSSAGFDTDFVWAETAGNGPDQLEYARRTLKLFQDMYPIDGIERLQTEHSVPLTRDDLAALVSMSEPLEAIGYRVHVNPAAQQLLQHVPGATNKPTRETVRS
ncbi:MAG: hypothetical protein KC475_01975 [Cyanobacteria bacterium HKST-UBA03]|nr:hypothetical protein [Cyanobacteria bacterium HKST-UBA03]